MSFLSHIEPSRWHTARFVWAMMSEARYCSSTRSEISCSNIHEKTERKVKWCGLSLRVCTRPHARSWKVPDGDVQAPGIFATQEARIIRRNIEKDDGYRRFDNINKEDEITRTGREDTCGGNSVFWVIEGKMYIYIYTYIRWSALWMIPDQQNHTRW